MRPKITALTLIFTTANWLTFEFLVAIRKLREKEQVIDNSTINLNNSGELINVNLQLTEIEQIQGRYRLSLRLVDRLGHTLKSGKPITLTNRGLIQYDRPEELNTLYVIFDYDVQNNTR